MTFEIFSKADMQKLIDRKIKAYLKGTRQTHLAAHDAKRVERVISDAVNAAVYSNFKDSE